ncbi:MAG TPA: hypothetical protein VLS93_16855 [Anaeromyxobacteraceae bacterium]|nr:hypothetical protein [Anaeromyxobacteraceae bacterium]
MDLPEAAAAALDRLRRSAADLRFEVRKACEQERWRLKVVYRASDPETGAPEPRELGLLWSDDRAAIQALRDRLARGEDGRTPGGQARPPGSS